MAHVAYRRIMPPQHLDARTFAQKLAEINQAFGELQQQMAEAQGLARDSVRLGNHLNMGGMRVTGVGQTAGEDDLPSVRELRDQALYARDGVHRTYKPIEAHGGIRTVTPAIAPNDLITRGQVETLITDITGASISNVSNSSGGTVIVTQIENGLAYPQASLVLVNGLNSNISVDASIYFRITGPTAPFSVGGFNTPDDGRLLLLHNASGQDMTLVREDVSTTTATHRIETLTGGNLEMQGNGFTQLIWSVADQRWMAF